METGTDRQVSRPVRINVVGVSGSGKSTFARRLSTLTGLPYVEMDALYWKPAWADSTDAEFFPKLESALAADEWVLDGNYSRTQPIKWARVNLVVWVDYSLPRTLWQAVSRACMRAFTKEELWPGTGNRESFRKSFFHRDSIIWWTITSRGRQRARYLKAMEDPAYSHIRFVRLASRGEADAYCRKLAGELAPVVKRPCDTQSPHGNHERR